MIKKVPYLLTFTVSFALLLLTFFITAIPARAETPIFDENYKSVHHYMSMHLIQPDQTGPTFLHDDQPDKQAAIVSPESSSAFTSSRSYLESIQFDVVSGILVGAFLLAAIAYFWKKGHERHSSSLYRIAH